MNNEQLTVAVIVVETLINQGADRIGAIDAVVHKAQLDNDDASQLVRELNKNQKKNN